MKNEIHAVLMRNLKGRPPVSDVFGKRGRAWLAELELPADERDTVDGGLRQIDFLDGEIAGIDREIATQALARAEMRRLMTVPGVDVMTAATFIAAIGDIHRFDRRKLVGYLGLDPACANPARRRPPRPDLQAGLRRRATSSSRPHGSRSTPPARCARSTSASGAPRRQIAIVAVARKLALLCSGTCSPANRTTPTHAPP